MPDPRFQRESRLLQGFYRIAQCRPGAPANHGRMRGVNASER